MGVNDVFIKRLTRQVSAEREKIIGLENKNTEIAAVKSVSQDPHTPLKKI